MNMLATMGGQIPILGAPQVQAQQPVAPVNNLGTIQAQIDAQKRQQALADALMSQGYTPNSGALGAIAQMFSAYAGKKLDRRAEEKISDAMARKFEEANRLEQEEAKAKDPMTQRMAALAKTGIDPASEQGQHYMLTGNLPSSSSKGPMNVSPGGAIVDPLSGRVIYQAGFAPRDQPKPGSGGPADEIAARRVALESEIIPGLKAEMGERFTPEMQQKVVADYLGTGKFQIADPSAKSAKPMPVGAMKADLEIEEALQAGQSAQELAAKHLARIESGEVDISPVSSGIGAVRRGLGIGNAKDANLAELKADLTAVVNASLRLNKGVQTEGDSARAYKEVMDSNDTATLKRALDRLTKINERGAALQERKRSILRKNYGQPDDEALPTDNGWSIQEVK